MREMQSNKKYVVCAGCIVFRMNEYGNIEFLLVKHSKSKNNWGIPKGHMEKGESIEETAVRELFEETGVLARLLYEIPPVMTSNKHENKVIFLFLAKQLNPQSNLKFDCEEISAASWFAIEHLPEVHPYQLPALKHAKNIIERNIEC